ncbi:hypothetical protein ACTWPT_56150 [Nonomuraea sp. 3N208]|uniref:hypothetical protein n=1 Tax=Nonomuraea sp. 3N208 TaxID=3457421 RepID=UPI003FD69580
MGRQAAKKPSYTDDEMAAFRTAADPIRLFRPADHPPLRDTSGHVNPLPVRTAASQEMARITALP